jgi:monofunctional biosynthetic peptidoglycan transglycosylase
MTPAMVGEAGIDSIAAVGILPGAGESRRMGRPKLLLPYGETTVVGAVVAALRQAGAAPIVLVTAPDDADLRRWAAEAGVLAAVNPAPARGMLSSIQEGLAALGGAAELAERRRTVLVTPADLPALRGETVAELLRRMADRGATLAVPVYRGRRGHPLAIAPDLLTEIDRLDPAVGLRELLDRHRDAVLAVEVDDPGAVSDVDHQEDYENLRSRWRLRQPAPRPASLAQKLIRATPSQPDETRRQPAPAEGLPLAMIAPPYEPPRHGRLKTLLRVALAAVCLGGLWLAWEALTWPDVAALSRARPRTTAFIERYRWGGWPLWWRSPRPIEWIWAPYPLISPNLKRAVLCGEDMGFFSHHGFESSEMRQALQDAWEEKKLPRGASTITQQLAKNLWLSRSRNPLRKLEEAALTRELEKRLSKRRILEIYLNVVELGPGIYGAEAAARHYFGKSARSLSEREAAQLAASLPYPAGWHPGAASRAYRRHVQTVLRRMNHARWLGSLI